MYTYTYIYIYIYNILAQGSPGGGEGGHWNFMPSTDTAMAGSEGMVGAYLGVVRTSPLDFYFCSWTPPALFSWALLPEALPVVHVLILVEMRLPSYLVSRMPTPCCLVPGGSRWGEADGARRAHGDMPGKPSPGMPSPGDCVAAACCRYLGRAAACAGSPRRVPHAGSVGFRGLCRGGTSTTRTGTGGA